MSISVFDVFKIGIGPSSSHTVGPMVAARRFLADLATDGLLDSVAQVSVQLYGSLALTGKGHGTDKAILLGLSGETPREVNPDAVEPLLERIRSQGRLSLLGDREIDFDEPMNLLMHRDRALPEHPNGMRFTAMDDDEGIIRQIEMYSVGGGFVRTAGDSDAEAEPEHQAVPYPFESARDLLHLGDKHGLAIHELVMANEQVWRDRATVKRELADIWDAMQACVARGFRTEGVLPGGLRVKRRAPALYRGITSGDGPDDMLDWVNAWALAVNEENAAGGRVVTAPTNGAAGVLPAVMHYYDRIVDGSDRAGIEKMLLTAGAIAVLYKKNASISGAEMGCQGEVGVACSMAAGGLMSALGGDNRRVENAAEIGMEHNLGLTCDPIAGLVQIPCIERNAMGAVKAINAVRIARRGDGSHKVSLDQVIATMRQTGEDMSSVYKETSQGGLAVNVIEC